MTVEANDLAGLEAWFVAGSLNLADTAAVTVWPDLSGNARHATPPLSANQPQFILNGIGGRPSVLFDGTDDYAPLASVPIPGSSRNYTIFAVYQKTGAGTDDDLVFTERGAGANTIFCTVGTRNGPVAHSINHGMRADDGTSHRHEGSTDNTLPPLVVGTPVVQVARFKNYVVFNEYNGLKTPGTLFAPTIDVVTPTGAAIGSTPAGAAGSMMAGYVSELAIFNRALPTEEYRALSDSLRLKYNVFASDTEYRQWWRDTQTLCGVIGHNHGGR